MFWKKTAPVSPDHQHVNWSADTPLNQLMLMDRNQWILFYSEALYPLLIEADGSPSRSESMARHAARLADIAMEELSRRYPH